MGEAARTTGSNHGGSNRGGRVIAGRYRIIKLLGRGGMAEVFLVQRVSELEGATKYFALKRILPQYADDPLRVKCFLDEVALAATVDHPNIIHVHDWGQDEDAGGSPFLVMDFVRGMDLHRLGERLAEKAKEEGPLYPGQERGLLPVESVCWAMLQAAIGLYYLHRQKRKEGDELGLIHRDFSPDNVMIDIRGHVRVTDLGIAKPLKGDQNQASATQHATGKPLYMPPEQWKGLPIDETADLYAFGVTLFELLTRRHPYDHPAFPNEDPMNKVMRAFQTDRLLIPELAPDVPLVLQPILERLIQGNRGKRPQSAEELFAPLKHVIASHGLDLQQVQQRTGELVGLVYLPPDTIVSMQAQPRPSEDAELPAESEKRPISRPSGNATSPAKPTPRTTPLGPALQDAPVASTAPFAHSDAPRSTAQKLRLAIAAGVVVLFGLLSFGFAFFVWPRLPGPATPAPGTTASTPASSTTASTPVVEPHVSTPAPANLPPPAAPPAVVDPPPAAPPAVVDPAAVAVVPPAAGSGPAAPQPPPASTGPSPGVEPPAVPPVAQATAAQGTPAQTTGAPRATTPRHRPPQPLTPAPIPRIAPVPSAPAPRNRGDMRPGGGDYGL